MSFALRFASYRPPIQIPLNIDSYDYRAICLFFACLLYGLFGSPTPEHLSIVEISVGALLCLSVGIGRARDVLFQRSHRRFWKSAGQVFLLYGLTIPCLIGVFSGHDVREVVRDIMPFLFLFMPLFLLPLMRARPYYFRSTLFVILMIGMLFSFRSILMHNVMGCHIWCTDDRLYLENMPTVLFTALFLIGTGLAVMMRGLTLKNTAVFCALLMFALVPIAAMVITVQRASLGAVALYVLLIQGFFIYKMPVRGTNALFMLVIVAAILNLSFAAIFMALWDKTQSVGLNMRPQEFEAVWSVMTYDPMTFLFGIGWGGHFNSPAVGGLNVNFTHNFFSSIFLKTGLIGVILCISYIAGLLERLSRVIIKNPVIGLALAAPILIDLTLYASFKSLDFGLVLLMISSSLVYSRQSESVQT